MPVAEGLDLCSIIGGAIASQSPPCLVHIRWPLPAVGFFAFFRAQRSRTPLRQPSVSRDLASDCPTTFVTWKQPHAHPISRVLLGTDDSYVESKEGGFAASTVIPRQIVTTRNIFDAHVYGPLFLIGLGDFERTSQSIGRPDLGLLYPARKR